LLPRGFLAAQARLWPPVGRHAKAFTGHIKSQIILAREPAKARQIAPANDNAINVDAVVACAVGRMGNAFANGSYWRDRESLCLGDFAEVVKSASPK